MATTKAKTEATTEAKTEATTEATEAKEKLVKVRLPRLANNADAEHFVSVNERTFLIKRGVEVEVPECVYEVLMNSEKMREEAFEREMALRK